MSKEIPFEKSFASHEKAKYWSDKNELKPEKVAKCSNKKFWFNCECGHEIEVRLNDVSLKGQWCGYCSNKKLCNQEDCKKCFEKSFASHEKSKYWSDLNELTPRQVFKNSHNKFIIKCEVCIHTFICAVSNIVCGHWCPYCTNQKLCDIQDCNECIEKSFANHEKVKYWSDINELKPRQVFKHSGTKIIFNCECGHNFIAVLASISTNNQWCPYCTNKKLCNKEDCNKCFKKSFASHEKSKYWSDKNKLKPINVFKNSNIKYIFDCICGHVYIAQLNNISTGYWCPYCSNPPQQLCDKEDCKQCFEKSFASHVKGKYWSSENKKLPHQVFKFTNKKYWLKCEKNHRFVITLCNIMAGKWCRFCINKTEQKLYDNLQPIYNNLEQQYKAEWCKSDSTNKCYPYDFILEEHKIIIELEGIQHFEQVSNCDSTEQTHERDKYKMKQANDNGYSVIRILQEDVFYDTYQWLEELTSNIEKLVSENKIQNIFMCKDNEYSIFTTL